MMMKNIEKKHVIKLFAAIMGVLIIAFLVELVINPTGNQLNIFFLKMDNFFADFFNILIYISDKDPYFNTVNSYGEKNYLPLPYLLLYPISCLDSFSSMTLEETLGSKIGVISCILFTFFSLALFYFSLYKLGKSKKSTILVLFLLFFSYINIFSIERGNFVVLAAGLVTVFLYLYNFSSKRRHCLAIIFISIAAVLKIYPALLGLLLLIDKKYKSIVVCIIIGLILGLLPFLFFHHGFENISQLISNVSLHTERYSPERIYPRFGLPHLVYFISLFANLPETLIVISKYIIILLSITSIILCYKTKNQWLKTALLSMIIIQLPTNSGLYTGLYFFPVIIMFFNKQFYTKKDLIYVLLFCMFLNPFQICLQGFSINYIFASIAMLTIWMLLLVDVFKKDEQNA